MSGTRRQFVDFSNNTNSDTGENTAASIRPIADGEGVTGSVLTRPSESLRQRSEAARDAAADTMYLVDADRNLVLSGPGKISWPGSTTASASGIPTINDTLWLIPLLTPGFPQVAPVPPVASAYGTMHLKRADNTNAILVTSQRRSYAAGDRISITVTAGTSFSVTLDTETGYSRNINIVATNTTTLGSVITALNAIIPSPPDNTQLVSAALEGGALTGDLILTTQAKQYMSGNYDGEAHAITPANLAAFFAGNPTQALAEGDTLCVSYPMVTDTASTGGRRQSIPENSNTAIPSGSFFNSRSHPENLVNAIPICKVINGSLVFATGAEIPAGSVNVALATVDPGSKIIRNGSFEHANITDTTRYAISHWENRTDLAVNGAWRANTTSPHLGGKQLEFNQTSTSAATGRLEQNVELPVVVGQVIRVTAFVKQLIAPTAGTYSIVLYWGDSTSAASSSSSATFQVLSTTDAAYRAVDQSFTVPGGKSFLKTVTVEVAGVTLGSTGVSLLVDDVQVFVAKQTYEADPVDDTRMATRTLDAILLEDPSSYSLGQLAALLRFDRTTPSGEGTINVERKDQTYDNSHLPPALALFGRILSLGAKLLGTETDSLKPRLDMPYSTAAATEYTLLWQSERNGEVSGSYTFPVSRLFADTLGGLVFTVNAMWNGTAWAKDVNGTTAVQIALRAQTSLGSGYFSFSFRDATANTAWADTAWTQQFLNIDQANALATIHNTKVLGDGINFNNSVMQVVANSQSQAGLLWDPQGIDGKATVAVTPFAGFLRKGSHLFDEFWGNGLDTNRWLESSAGAGSTGINTDTHEYFMTPATASGNYQQINSRNYGAYSKNNPRFSARIRTHNLNPTSTLGAASGILIGFSNFYLLYDQTVHTSRWWLHCNGTDYDTGLASNQDGLTGNSAGQIVHFAVIDSTHVAVAIQDQNQTWSSANIAIVTVASIPAGPFEALATIVNHNAGSSPTLYVDFMQAEEVSRKD